MSYQKCPVCNGTGIDPKAKLGFNTQNPCTVCKGKKIINTLTGLPPEDKKTNF